MGAGGYRRDWRCGGASAVSWGPARRRYNGAAVRGWVWPAPAPGRWRRAVAESLGTVARWAPSMEVRYPPRRAGVGCRGMPVLSQGSGGQGSPPSEGQLPWGERQREEGSRRRRLWPYLVAPMVAGRPCGQQPPPSLLAIREGRARPSRVVKKRTNRGGGLWKGVAGGSRGTQPRRLPCCEGASGRAVGPGPHLTALSQSGG